MQFYKYQAFMEQESYQIDEMMTWLAIADHVHPQHQRSYSLLEELIGETQRKRCFMAVSLGSGITLVEPTHWHRSIALLHEVQYSQLYLVSYTIKYERKIKKTWCYTKQYDIILSINILDYNGENRVTRSCEHQFIVNYLFQIKTRKFYTTRRSILRWITHFSESYHLQILFYKMQPF